MAMRALIADDHPMCREIGRMALGAAVGAIDVVEASTLEEALAVRAPVDLVLLDLELPDSRGLASLVDVARERPGTPILILSGHDDSGFTRYLAKAGAAGFVSKAAPITDIITAIKAVVAGQTYFDVDCAAEAPLPPAQRLALLTSAESRVLRAMRDGRMNKQIAFDLGLSEITVKQHVKAILRKLVVVNRTQAVLLLHGIDERGSPDPNE